MQKPERRLRGWIVDTVVPMLLILALVYWGTQVWGSKPTEVAKPPVAQGERQL